MVIFVFKPFQERHSISIQQLFASAYLPVTISPVVAVSTASLWIALRLHLSHRTSAIPKIVTSSILISNAIAIIAGIGVCNVCRRS
jgi:hypothetical protein